MSIICNHCGALRFKEESSNFCCSNGRISLPEIPEPPAPLSSLLCAETPESRKFLRRIRDYNSCFQMTSFGTTAVSTRRFNTTFTIQGQIYHSLGPLQSQDNDEPKFIQIYFMDSEQTEIDRRHHLFDHLDKNIIQQLQQILHENNELIQQFQFALEHIPNDSYNIIIRADRTPAGQHERRFNAPTTNEVAVIITQNQGNHRDIVIKKKNSNIIHVNECHRFYDALQYPIIFWSGQEGYYFNIPQTNPIDRSINHNKKVSCMNFYCYHFMVRQNNFNTILKCRQLFQQYAVDMYAKVESERLTYIQTHQQELRSDSYIRLQDAMRQDANLHAQDIGKITILPSSFINSPRYLSQMIQDTFCYVRIMGKPDLFITFTCNPKWTEITSNMFLNQQATDRHDIVARVFNIKVKQLIKLIQKGKIFGKILALIYSIEWQKRGLPHTHMLVWLENKIRPNEIDEIIRAEIPDRTIDPLLYDIVVENMVHGPCGILNPHSPCMKNQKCSKNFPKNLLAETQFKENSYPLYRRRAVGNGGFKTTKVVNNIQCNIDNRWIVPYSPFLCKTFNAHINVEVCNTVDAIKYICKYVYKGTDQAVFNLDNGEIDINEVKSFKTGRYISTNEALWRIFSLDMHERYPPVQRLAVHLENGQQVYFNEQNLRQRLEEPINTTLIAFFKLCNEDDFAKTLLYPDVPKYYRWDTSKKWIRRKQGDEVPNWPEIRKANVVSRIYTVHVTNFDCFCLRLLLHNIHGPTSFVDLRTIDGVQYNNYIEACEFLGLLENDNQWTDTMADAVLCKSPNLIRELFATLMSFCGLSNPNQLWEHFRNDLCQDIFHRAKQQNPNIQYNNEIYNEGLINIENKVMAMCGKKLTDFNLPATNRNILHDLQTDYNIQELRQYVENSIPLLNLEQKQIYNTIMKQLQSNSGGVFFLDAPGGTGKTFLLNLLLASVRQNEDTALAVASSGIASTLLDGGRTAHSLFKLPLNLNENDEATCNITKNSQIGQIIKRAKLLVWDEAPMLHKNAFEACDRTFKDIRNNNKEMGNMVVVLAGDFRQTLPIIQKGTAIDEINACLKSSYLWKVVKKMSLKKNMRVHLDNNENAAYFSALLLKIGNGNVETDETSAIQLPEVFKTVRDRMELIDKIFPQINKNFTDDEWICKRSILATTNETVDLNNSIIMNKIKSEEKVYKSNDVVTENDDTIRFPTEFLNSIELPGLPPHRLTLKKGVVVMLLRNLQAPKLCNGTRLRIIESSRHILKCKVLTGPAKGETTLIPRIPMIPSNIPIPFKRIQFPVKVAFSMTINKSQGQSIHHVGADLSNPCFSHGQFYVLCSRATNQENIYFLTSDNSKTTKNIVYRDVLK